MIERIWGACPTQANGTIGTRRWYWRSRSTDGTWIFGVEPDGLDSSLVDPAWLDAPAANVAAGFAPGFRLSGTPALDLGDDDPGVRECIERCLLQAEAALLYLHLPEAEQRIWLMTHCALCGRELQHSDKREDIYLGGDRLLIGEYSRTVCGDGCRERAAFAGRLADEAVDHFLAALRMDPTGGVH